MSYHDYNSTMLSQLTAVIAKNPSVAERQIACEVLSKLSWFRRTLTPAAAALLDAVIAAIRGSADRPEARTALMAEPFSFSEDQSNHILDMTLGRLTRLGRSELESEMQELRQTIAALEEILGDPARLRGPRGFCLRLA